MGEGRAREAERPWGRSGSSRRSTRVLGLVVGACWAAVGLPALAEAAPPQGDDWSIEAREDDETLVGQRLRKLHGAPFDGKQWRALERAIGRSALTKRLIDASRADPKDLAWAILAARAKLVRDDPAGAAETLASVTSTPPKLARARGFWAGAVELRVDALLRAERTSDALAALDAAASLDTNSSQRGGTTAGPLRWVRRALKIAKEAELRDDVQRIGTTLLETRGSTLRDALDVARAASTVAATDLAGSAFAKAQGLAKGRERVAIILERAAYDVRRGEGSAAADAVWATLTQRGDTQSGSNTIGGEMRTRAFAILEEAHRITGTLDVLVKRIEYDIAAHPDGLARDARAHRTLARAREDLGQDPVPDLRRALELTERQKASSAEVEETRAALVQALERRGDVDEATLLAAKARGRSGADTPLALAERLLAAGQRKQALALLDSVARDAGRDDELRLRLVDVFNEMGERELALAQLERLASARPRDPDARIALGDQLFELGRVDDAFVQWRLLPKLVRPAHAGWARYAEVLLHHQYARTRTPEGAATPLQAVEKALAQRPSDPTYLRLRAVIHEERREADEALEAWDAVRRIADAPHEQPLRDEARTRVVELVTQGNLRRPRHEVKTAYLVETRARIEGGDLEDVREWARFAAELHARDNQHQSALDIVDVARQRFPDDVPLLELLAQAQRRAGRIAEATKTLQRVAELAPEREATALASVAELAVERGATAESLRAAKQAAARDRDGAQLLLRVGELHESRGALDAAAAAYEAALTHGGATDEAQLHLGKLAAVRGEFDDATSRLTELVTSATRPETAARAGASALALIATAAKPSDERSREDHAANLVLLAAVLNRLQRDRGDDDVEGLLLDVLDTLQSGTTRHGTGARDPRGSGQPSDATGALEIGSVSWLRDWSRDEPTRSTRLRAALLQTVTSSRLEHRRRAAEHLGLARLTGAGAGLVRFAQTALPAHDAPRTVVLAHREMRSAAIIAAGRIDDADAIPGLARIMRDESDGVLRRAAAWALASSAHAEALAALEAFVKGEPLARVESSPAREAAPPAATATRSSRDSAGPPNPILDVHDVSPLQDRGGGRGTTGRGARLPSSGSAAKGGIVFDVTLRPGHVNGSFDVLASDEDSGIEYESRLLALVCLGIAGADTPLPSEVAKALRVRTARAASSVRHACTLPFVRRAMTNEELLTLVDGGDPVLSSVAFDRWVERATMGPNAATDLKTWTKVWTLALGAPGHLRDRARGALALRDAAPSAGAAKTDASPSPGERPARGRTRGTAPAFSQGEIPRLANDGWSDALAAWVLAPVESSTAPPVRPGDAPAIEGAIAALQAGTASEQAALRKLTQACEALQHGSEGTSAKRATAPAVGPNEGDQTALTSTKSTVTGPDVTRDTGWRDVCAVISDATTALDRETPR